MDTNRVTYRDVQGVHRDGTFAGVTQVQTGEMQVTNPDGKAVWVKASNIISKTN